MGGQRSGARAHNRRRTQQLLADLLAGQHAVARLIRQSHSSANQINLQIPATVSTADACRRVLTRQQAVQVLCPRLSRVLAGTGDARIDRLCHLRRDVMREFGQLRGGQVLGKIEGGDDIAVRHLHKPSPIVHYALGRSRLRAREHGHHLVYRRLDLLIVPSRLRHDLPGELTQIRWQLNLQHSELAAARFRGCDLLPCRYAASDHAAHGAACETA